MASRRRLFVIDGSSYIFRAFYAIRHLSNSKGFPTNAIYGFTVMLMKVIRDHAPDEVVMTFDTSEPTFRKEMYELYKANRSEPPEELVPQFPRFADIVRAFRIPVLSMHGFEADDIIATVARAAVDADRDVTVVTGDKDLMQLVSPRIQLLDTMKDRVIDREGVIDYFGVPPEQVVDLQGLMGDSTDNIPGIKGIGKKKGAQLLERFGSLEAVLKGAEEVGGKTGQVIADSREEALLSRELARMKDDVPIDIEFDNWQLEEPDSDALHDLFQEFEFNNLIKELAPKTSLSRDGYRSVTTAEQLDALIKELSAVKALAVDTETTSTDPLQAELVGISCSWADGQAAYIPVAHQPEAVPTQLDRDEVLDALRPILEGTEHVLYGQNLKYDLHIFRRFGVSLSANCQDTMLASYVLKPSRRSHGLDALAQEYFGHTMISFSDVAGKGRNQKTFDHVALEPATEYACEDADLTFRLANVLFEELATEKTLQTLYEEIELPLLPVLASMEAAGVRVERTVLDELSTAFDERAVAYEKEIYEIAGEEFNIGSPKQLQVILYEKLGLPPGKKTKTGYSTNAAELERLASLHPVAEKIVQYRMLTKLKSTYVDALPEMIHPDTGRIHTSYGQTTAATGRLSSSDPNLQNIPIRTEEGRLIRKAFLPADGCRFIAADYSQVELRILAHLSGDKVLIEAFREGEDIHQRTASEVFDVMPMAVTPEQRRDAKAINFGIIYGMSSHGLAGQLGIPRGQAQEYIDAYFERYSGVHNWIEKTLDIARRTGEVTTMFGRRRSLDDLPISETGFSGFGARVAINTPIQGTAADLIKKAMLTTSSRLNEELPSTRLILQIHDELILEAPEGDADAARDLLRECMEGVDELKVPLQVETSIGETWAALK